MKWVTAPTATAPTASAQTTMSNFSYSTSSTSSTSSTTTSAHKPTAHVNNTHSISTYSNSICIRICLQSIITYSNNACKKKNVASAYSYIQQSAPIATPFARIILHNYCPHMNSNNTTAPTATAPDTTTFNTDNSLHSSSTWQHKMKNNNLTQSNSTSTATHPQQ